MKVHVEGIGTDPIDIVRRGIRMRDEEGDRYDQVWCVFDRDNWPRDKFNNAIASAKQEGIAVAYSNEAFELWYWLHFQYGDTGMGRTVLQQKLTQELGQPYNKTATNMYRLLLNHQDTAIKNAERLMGAQAGLSPADANPSTTVHLLVQELNKHSRP